MRGIAGASIAAAALALAPAADAGKTPPEHSYTGQISEGHDRYAAANGKVAITIAAPAFTGSSRKLSLTFSGHRCGKTKHGYRLRGKLKGTITPVYGGNPDIGRSFSVKASGKLKPLGRVSADGSIHSPGNILEGRIIMQLTLKTKRGRMTVDAQS